MNTKNETMHERVWLCQLIDECLEHYPRGIPVLYNPSDYSGSHSGYLDHRGSDLIIRSIAYKWMQSEEIPADSNGTTYNPKTGMAQGWWRLDPLIKETARNIPNLREFYLSRKNDTLFVSRAC